MQPRFESMLIVVVAAFCMRLDQSVERFDHDPIDLLAILRKSLDRAIFLYKFIHENRKSGVTASIAIVHIRKFN